MSQRAPPSIASVKFGDKLDYDDTKTLRTTTTKDQDNLASILPTPSRTRQVTSPHVTFADQVSDAQLPGVSLHDLYSGDDQSPLDKDITQSKNTTTLSKNTAITVFGFPNGTAHTVSSLFKAYGQIIKLTEGRGNWIVIEYDSEWAVSRALARNGTILPGTNAMIGVVAGYSGDCNAGNAGDGNPLGNTQIVDMQPKNYATSTLKQQQQQPIYADAGALKQTALLERIAKYLFG